MSDDAVDLAVPQFDDQGVEGEPSRPFRLTEEQIQQISARLREGKALPPYLLPHLFERPREYELAYGGKMRRADVLAETMALPLQREKTFGVEDDGAWSNMLILGDNLQVLRTLLSLKEQGELRNADGTDGVRLCYIDPPFATRREFMNKRGEQVFEDRVAGAEFVEFLRRRLILIRELLSSDGSLYLHLDTNKAHYMKVILDEIFGPQNFRGEIIWKRSSAHSDGGQGSRHFGRIHDTILFYSKSNSYVWHPQYVPHDESYVVGKYASIEPETGRRYQLTDITGPGGAAKGNPRYEVMGVTKYWRYSKESMEKLIEEGRIVQTKPGGVPRYKRYLDEQEGLPLQDIWTDISPVNSQAKDRQGYPTQKPLALVERILRASSDTGDLVLDCFAGSGTTAVAAEMSKRRWVTVDCAKFASYTTQARLLGLEAEGKAPFTTYNAGLYDYQALRSLDWTDYRSFALRLFQCRDEPFMVGGFRFDGVFQDDPVHVFDVKAHAKGANIGAAYVQDLVDVCGAGLGERCFIVAPALSVDLYEDYIDVAGTRFFFLRIPYSVIAELHKRAFSELRQPTSQQVANSTIDSVGFDFMQPPRVECDYKRSSAAAGGLEVIIKGFTSQAYMADESGDDISDLAMVLVDMTYDGEVFDVDHVYYAEDLSRSAWSIRLTKEGLGHQVMLVYLDVFGNEFRETKTIADFEDVSMSGVPASA